MSWEGIFECSHDFDTLMGDGGWFAVPVTNQTIAGQKSKCILWLSS